MNSKLVTYPDIADTTVESILLIMPDPMALDLILSSVNTFTTDFNIYLTGEESDAEWFKAVQGIVGKVFKQPSFDEVYQYLKTVDERK